jgi:hypothetical protein
MKTKTLVSTLTSMRVISQQQDDFGGELLSEAVLVKNIVEEMLWNAITLHKIIQKLLKENSDFEALRSEGNLAVNLQRLQECLVSFKNESPKITDPSYNDTDSEGIDERVSFRHGGRLRPTHRRDLMTISRKELEFIRPAREILLQAQNDRNTMEVLKQLELGEQEAEDLPHHLRILEMLVSSSVSRITIPQVTYVHEIESLCASISLKHKFEKIVLRLKNTLSEIETSHEESVRKKEAEKLDLEDNIARIREGSQQVIHEHLEYVKSRMKVLCWNSHGRQSKTIEQINELRAELEDVMDEHAEAEAHMRSENWRLEQDLKDMINKYDAEMFQRHYAIEDISKDYAVEKESLRKLLEELAVVAEERDKLKEENRIEEQRLVDRELDRIRKIIAAKAIQRAWRSYKTRMLLKSKKKKKKRTASHK